MTWSGCCRSSATTGRRLDLRSGCRQRSPALPPGPRRARGGGPARSLHRGDPPTHRRGLDRQRQRQGTPSVPSRSGYRVAPEPARGSRRLVGRVCLRNGWACSACRRRPVAAFRFLNVPLRVRLRQRALRGTPPAAAYPAAVPQTDPLSLGGRKEPELSPWRAKLEHMFASPAPEPPCS